MTYIQPGFSPFKQTDPPEKKPEHEKYYIQPGMTFKEELFSKSKVPTAAGERDDKIVALEGELDGIIENPLLDAKDKGNKTKIKRWQSRVDAIKAEIKKLKG